MNYDDLPPQQLVELLANKAVRNDAIIALVGGISATELKHVEVSSASKAAIFSGLQHENTTVRWWCIQLMDHIADVSYIEPLMNVAFNDPLPKNRRHAVHALVCEKCKPDGCLLNFDIASFLKQIIQTDADWSVKMLALEELEELTDAETVAQTIASLNGTEQIQIKALYKTQAMSQDTKQLLSYAKQVQGWRGRTAYQLITAIENLLEATTRLLMGREAEVISPKVDNSLQHIVQAIDAITQHQSKSDADIS